MDALIYVVVIVLLGSQWLIRSQRRRIPRYRYRGVRVYVGDPGTGKSYRMVELLLESLAQGRGVVINFDLRPFFVVLALVTRYGLTRTEAVARLRKVRHLEGFEDLIEAYDEDVYIDEAQDVLNSQYWTIYPDEVITWFAQHRHRRCRVVLATHKLSRLHNYVRELISDIYRTAVPIAAFYPVLALWHRTSKQILMYRHMKASDELKPVSGFKGGDWVGRAEFCVINLLVARCYDHEGGVRRSPLSDWLDQHKPSRIRLKLPPRRRSLACAVLAVEDGLPHVTWEEYMELLDRGQHPSAVLRARWPASAGSALATGTPL